MPKIKRTFASADATENAFYDAMTRGDLDAMMGLWAEEDEIVCIHPGAPRLIGHAAIRASWEAIFARGCKCVEAGDSRVDALLFAAPVAMLLFALGPTAIYYNFP